MPSVEHESYVELFLQQPALAVRVLQEALGVKVPAYAEARAEVAKLDQVVPTQYRADLTVKLLNGEAVFAIVVEVQLSRDPDKPYTWPAYLMQLRERWRCPTALLVVAPEEGVARWCARTIETGHQDFVLRPYVAGPGNLPVVTQEEVACEAPEWAMLSVLAHGQGEQGEAIARAVLPGLVGLDEGRSRFYFDLMVRSLNDAARAALEALMQSGTYEYTSEFARRFIEQGHEQGHEQGLEQGLQRGESGALLTLLEARGIPVDEPSRQRIVACTDRGQLKRWLIKALSVRAIHELFEPEPPSSR
jgi:hypothetical protein